MKRLYYLIGLIAVGAMLVAPLGFGASTLGHNAQVSSNMALAAGSKPTPSPTPATDFLGMPGCVKIAVPLVNKGGNCVDNSTSSGGAIVNYLRGWLLLMSGVIGTIIMVVLVVAGIQYITSVGDPSLIKAAKKRIFNAITALLLFLMMFAILTFLIPGGIL